MELNKKRFKKDEVEMIINKINLHYNKKLSDCYSIINDLKEENRQLQYKIDEYKSNEMLINTSIKEATKKSREIDTLAEKKYNAEILSLIEFHRTWSKYFSYIFEKYPLYPTVQKLRDVSDKLNKIFSDNSDSKSKIQKIKKIIPNENAIFNPKRKIEEYIASTSDNGFNLEEVLNPGELKLEDLCKELGLID